jgi:hypothetical protein
MPRRKEKVVKKATKATKKKRERIITRFLEETTEQTCRQIPHPAKEKNTRLATVKPI